MEILSRMAAVGAVLALLAGLLWWLRGRGFASIALPGASGRVIEVLESRALGAHHVLHVVRVGDRALVLAAHPAGCSLVESRPVAEIRPGDRKP
jgi:flagellar biogenesis protein FliO